MTEFVIAEGERLFVQGDPADRLYLVGSGTMKITRRAGDGRQLMVALAGPRCVFGELALFDAGPRSADATAFTDTTLFQIHHEEFWDRASQSPHILMALLRLTAQRLRHSQRCVAAWVGSDVPTRVARLLVDFAELEGVRLEEGRRVVRVRHGLSQLEMAQLVGSDRASVNKALNRFVDRGWLRIERRGALVLDFDSLARRAM